MAATAPAECGRSWRGEWSGLRPTSRCLHPTAAMLRQYAAPCRPTNPPECERSMHAKDEGDPVPRKLSPARLILSGSKYGPLDAGRSDRRLFQKGSRREDRRGARTEPSAGRCSGAPPGSLAHIVAIVVPIGWPRRSSVARDVHSPGQNGLNCEAPRRLGSERNRSDDECANTDRQPEKDSFSQHHLLWPGLSHRAQLDQVKMGVDGSRVKMPM